ncbi:MAG: hypothetical protein JRJ85_27960 [Deltaproteobacteria bacterium]|nr:hypothetical protein [Deltaproteobacteria bacterium]
MEEIKQKYIIRVTERGLTERGFVIQKGDETRLEFTPVEALMLLDILKNEESAIKLMAEKATPLPTRIRFR